MTKRIHDEVTRRTRGRGWVGLLIVLALVLVFAIGASATGSIGTAAGFEDDDGNLAVDSTFDWNGFSPTWSTNPAAPYRTASTSASGWSFKGFEDDSVSNNDSGFAGGVKQDNDCGTTKDGKAPNKDDLKRIYLATKTVSGNVFLMIAWVRISQNSQTSSAHIGYEFNQADRTVSTNFCGGTPNLLKRTGGDMLVVYDFEGGSDLHIKLSRWLTTAWVAANAPGATCEVNNSTIAGGCWGNTKVLTDTGFAEGAVYQGTTAITDAIKPPGATDPGQVEFGEAGLNLTGAGVFTSGQCSGFGTAYAVSRSSGNSQQAAMEDIVGPGAFTISNCGTVNIHKEDDVGTPLQGVKFNLYVDNSPFGPPDGGGTNQDAHGAEDVKSNTLFCTTGSDGNCSITNVPIGKYWVVEDPLTIPANHNGAPDQYADISAGGVTVSLTFVDPRQPGSVSVHKQDESGNPVANAVLTLYNDNGSTTATTGPPDGLGPHQDAHGAEDTAVSGKSCTTDAAGDCTIPTVQLGNYWVVETTTPSGYTTAADGYASITTGGQNVAVTMVDPRSHRVIVIVCHENGTPSLYSTTNNVSLTVGATTTQKTSISAVPAGLVAKGVTQADLCGLGGASFGGLTHGTFSPSVTIASH